MDGYLSAFDVMLDIKGKTQASQDLLAGEFLAENLRTFLTRMILC